VSDEAKKEIGLEIGHVLFIDIVGYSKLLITEQREQLQTLKEIVRGTEQFRLAEAEGKLLRLPTGDGGALVFRTSPEAPVLCAVEISKELKKHSELRVRMGIHSGPVSEIADLNEQANIAGAGINIAQRVMDCGDAGHILVTKHVAEDLEHYPRWRPYLHDLGECEVKHGMRVGVVNLYAHQVGNAQAPKKFQALKKRRVRVRWAEVAIALLVFAAIVAAFVFLLRRPTRSAMALVEKSIAVLPFDNLSRDPENAFFADGVQDEILTDLARIADLKVISRTSVMHYKSGIARNLREIGEQLGVAHVLEGSVQRSANRVRVNAQLVDARTDQHLWAQTYDRDLVDVFAIQSEIAKAIAEQLQAKLSPSEKKAIDIRPTKDLVAFDLYTRGKNLILAVSLGNSPSTLEMLRAIDLLNQAVARDSSFFDAYSQLALAHDLLYMWGADHTPSRLAVGQSSVEAAARLRPNAGETHLARAHHLYAVLDFDGALAELELARQTLPNDAGIFQLIGFIQRRQPGRYEESTRNLEHAVDLDPRNVLTLNQIATYNYPRRGRYADAKSAWDRLLTITPDDVTAKTGRAQVDLDWKADTRPLHQTIDSIRAENSGSLPTIADSWILCAIAERDAAGARNALSFQSENSNPFGSEQLLFNRPFIDAVIARMTHDDAKARSAFTAARADQEKIVQAQPDNGFAFCVLGLIDAGLGRREEALREGHRALELVPVEKDVPDGLDMVEYFAMIAAWVGEKDLACEQLNIAIHGPSGLTYGKLKLLPLWDPLRGDPRFEQIVASLAPKQ